MDDFPHSLLPSRTLWQVVSLGRQTLSPGTPYWWDNRDRGPADQVVIQFIESGEITLRRYLEDGFLDTPVRQGQMFIFTLYESTAYGFTDRNEQSYRTSWLNLAGAGLTDHWRGLIGQHGPVFSPKPDDPIFRWFHQLQRVGDPAAGEDVLLVARTVAELVYALFGHALASRRRESPPVEQAIEAIMQHPTRAWSLKEVAAAFGVSREHLSRVFTEQVGQSPAAYLQKERLTRATALLLQSDLTISEIARQTGLGTPHTLSRLMRSQHGQTPGQFRQSRSRDSGPVRPE